MRTKRTKRNTWQWLVLVVTAVLTLTACQKTTPFSYDPEADILAEAEKVISGPGIVFDPNVEKIIVITAAFNADGEGVLQEYQMGEFGVATVNTVPGGKVVVSVPLDPKDGSHWQLSLNEHKTSSRPYLPSVYQPTAGKDYHRLNFLLEPTFNSDVYFTLFSAEGDQLWTFRVTIQGAAVPQQ